MCLIRENPFTAWGQKGQVQRATLTAKLGPAPAQDAAALQTGLGTALRTPLGTSLSHQSCRDRSPHRLILPCGGEAGYQLHKQPQIPRERCLCHGSPRAVVKPKSGSPNERDQVPSEGGSLISSNCSECEKLTRDAAASSAHTQTRTGALGQLLSSPQEGGGLGVSGAPPEGCHRTHLQTWCG